MNTQVDYSLQEQIKELKIPSAITIVGTGGFGAWAALFAALSGVKKMILFDPGRVDGKDLARSPFTIKQLGMPKVVAMLDLILERRLDIDIKIHERGFEVGKDDNLIEGIIFQGASNQHVAEGLASLAKKKNIGFIVGAYKKLDAHTFNFLPSSYKTSDVDVPVWVGATAFSGVLAIYSAFIQPLNFVGSLRSLHMNTNDLNDALNTIGMLSH